MSNVTMLLPSTCLRVSPTQTSRELGDEAIILQLERGVYYGMEGVGARVWQLLQSPITLQEIHTRLFAEYDVPAAQLERDLQTLVQRLLDAGLVEVCS